MWQVYAMLADARIQEDQRMADRDRAEHGAPRPAGHHSRTAWLHRLVHQHI